MVWVGEGLQCPSDGPTWTKFRRPVQLLFKAFHDEDCSDVGRSSRPFLPLFYQHKQTIFVMSKHACNTVSVYVCMCVCVCVSYKHDSNQCMHCIENDLSQ